MEILLIVLLAFTVQGSEVKGDLKIKSGCKNYACATPTKGECFYETSTTASISLCQYGYVCNLQNGNCTFPIDPSPQAPYANINEKCNYSLDCLYDATCEKGYCVGANEGSPCINSNYCNEGLYCDTNLSPNACAKQIELGLTGCTGDYDCVNNGACNITSSKDRTQNKCIKAFSQPENAPVYCSATGSSSLCSSYYCLNTRRTTFGVCYPTLPNKNSNLPLVCSVDSDCQTENFNGTPLEDLCECSYSGSASSYCRLFPGDPEYLEYTKQLNLWLDSDAIMNCNTMQSLGSACMWIYWDKMNYYKFMYLKAQLDNYPQIQDNPDCAKSLYTKGYWNAYYDYTNYMAANETPVQFLDK